MMLGFIIDTGYTQNFLIQLWLGSFILWQRTSHIPLNTLINTPNVLGNDRHLSVIDMSVLMILSADASAM